MTPRATTLGPVLVSCAVALSVGARPSAAQTLQEQDLEQQGFGQPTPSSRGWNVTLGGALVEVPRYPGADTDHERLRPLGLIAYRDMIFLGPAGLGANLINSGRLRAGPVIGLLPGRSESRDPQLTGLGDIPNSVTAGVFARYRIGKLELSGTVREAITHTGNGLLGLVQADYRVTPRGGRLLFLLGPDLEFADSRYSQTWFGITPTQSLYSGLPVYTPRAGLRDVGFHASLTYRCTEHVLLRTFGNFKELMGDMADSPIVQRRSQALMGVGFAYHF